MRRTIGMITVVVVMLISTVFVTSGDVYARDKVVSVADFGAKGDGMSDDTAAIQKALHSVAGKGITLYFPAGTYRINPVHTLQVGSDITMAGDGEQTVLKADFDFGWEMIRATGSNIVINNMVLDGNDYVHRVIVIGGGSSHVSLNKLVVANATHSTNSASKYYAGVVSGVVVYGNSRNIALDQIEVKNIRAIHLTAGSYIARGIYITTTWGSQESVPEFVSITNSYIHHIGPADDGDGIYYEDRSLDRGQGKDTGSLIANNTFDYNAKRAIKLYAQGVTVKNNKIMNPYSNNNYYADKSKSKPAPDMFAGISVYGSNNTVINNVLNGEGSYYAAIEVSANQTVGNVTIQGNYIKMGLASNTKGTTAIRLGNTASFRVTGNTIVNAEKGVWTWQSAMKGQIEDNNIYTTGGGVELTTYVKNTVKQDIFVDNNKINTVTAYYSTK